MSIDIADEPLAIDDIPCVEGIAVEGIAVDDDEPLAIGDKVDV